MVAFPSGQKAHLTLRRTLEPMLRQSRLLQAQSCCQHGDTSCLLHSVAVAYFSCRAADLLPFSFRREELVRGALLHDYFLYDWHDPDPAHRLHGFRHPFTALRNAARDFSLSPVERDAILRHMFPLVPIPPKSPEGVMVCLVDKACSLYETVRRKNAYPLLSRRVLAPALGRAAGQKRPLPPGIFDNSRPHSV